MMVDITCGLVLVFFAIIGACFGFIRQVFSLIAVGLIALFALPLGLAAARPLLDGRDWSDASVLRLKLGLALLAAVVIYAAVKFVGRLVNRSIGRREAEGGEEPRLAPWNRYWGVAFSVLEAGVLCWLVLAFFAAFPHLWPSATRAVQASSAVRTADAFNPFEHWIRPEKRSDLEQALLALWRLRTHPGTWGAIAREESVQRVLKQERIVKLLDEGNGDFTAVLADPAFRKVVADINWQHVAHVARRALADAERRG